ncbi:MAG: outer membrane beta-barrel protein [Rhodospirillales bacterium]
MICFRIRKPVLGVILLVVLTLAPGFARADTNELGFYLGGRLLPAMSTIDGYEQAGGTGGTFEQIGDDYDSTAGVSLLLGYHWNEHGLPVRTEIEYGYRFRNDFNTRENPFPNPVIGYKNDLATHFLMFNGYVDFATDSPWRPFIGAGFGWARNSSSTTRSGNDPSVSSQTIETDTDNLAYSFSAGTRVAISSEWIGEIGYRYIEFGEVDTGQFSTGDSVTADSHVSHDIVLGVAYLF